MLSDLLPVLAFLAGLSLLRWWAVRTRRAYLRNPAGRWERRMEWVRAALAHEELP